MIATATQLTAAETVKLKAHPVANLFPMIAEAEYAQFREDVRLHGVREPGWVWQEPGKDFLWLVDGRNRRRIALDLNIELPVRYWGGDSTNALAVFIMSLNFHRRDLKAGQRAAIYAEMLEHLEADARKRQAHGQTGPGRTLRAELPTAFAGRATEQAAKVAKVSRRTMQDAKKVLKKGHRKLTRAMKKGTVSASDAVRVADLPAEQQLEALKKVEEGAAKTLAAAVAEDDLEAAVKRGTAKLKAARKLFDKIPGKAPRQIVASIDRAIELASSLT